MREKLVLAELREFYKSNGITPEDLADNPFDVFHDWMKEAISENLVEPNAMILSTVNEEGQPSSRTVLLKDIHDDGLIFYSNYNSQKGKEIEGNNRVSLLFLWLDLARQVRISGIAEKTSKEISQQYFSSRPRGSQLGAWVSPQSEVLPDRGWMDNKFAEISNEFNGSGVIPLPEFWGGYKVKPATFEFWQGRSNRLHDRVRFRKENEEWIKERLAP